MSDKQTFRDFDTPTPDDDRGAASVTLDTINAPLLLQLIKDWPDNESDAEFAERSARAVTDALLANWEAVDEAIEAHCVSLKVSKS